MRRGRSRRNLSEELRCEKRLERAGKVPLDTRKWGYIDIQALVVQRIIMILRICIDIIEHRVEWKERPELESRHGPEFTRQFIFLHH